MIVVGIFVSLAITMLWGYESSRLKRLKFSKRKKLTDSAFFYLFKQVKGNLFLEQQVIYIRNEIAFVSDIDEALLLPTDNINDLGPAKGWEYDGDDFCDYLDELCGRAKQCGIETKCNTLADMIELKILIDAKDLIIEG